MPKVLKMPKLIVSNEFIENFKRADNTFKYQIVFDPITRKQVPLNPYNENLSSEDFPYAGG
jgi:exonuclease 1